MPNIPYSERERKNFRLLMDVTSKLPPKSEYAPGEDGDNYPVLQMKFFHPQTKWTFFPAMGIYNPNGSKGGYFFFCTLVFNVSDPNMHHNSSHSTITSVIDELEHDLTFKPTTEDRVVKEYGVLYSLYDLNISYGW